MAIEPPGCRIGTLHAPPNPVFCIANDGAALWPEFWTALRHNREMWFSLAKPLFREYNYPNSTYRTGNDGDWKKMTTAAAGTHPRPHCTLRCRLTGEIFFQGSPRGLVYGLDFIWS